MSGARNSRQLRSRRGPVPLALQNLPSPPRLRRCPSVPSCGAASAASTTRRAVGSSATSRVDPRGRHAPPRSHLASSRPFWIRETTSAYRVSPDREGAYWLGPQPADSGSPWWRPSSDSDPGECTWRGRRFAEAHPRTSAMGSPGWTQPKTHAAIIDAGVLVIGAWSSAHVERSRDTPACRDSLPRLGELRSSSRGKECSPSMSCDMIGSQTSGRYRVSSDRDCTIEHGDARRQDHQARVLTFP